MATHRPALPPLKLAAALGAATLAAVATAMPTLTAHAVARPTASTSGTSTCNHSADWNTMVPDGQCPAYRS